jgi:hypothetical protein
LHAEVTEDRLHWGIGRNASWKVVSQSSYPVWVFDTIRETAVPKKELPRIGGRMTVIDPQTRAVAVTETSRATLISPFPAYSNEAQ